MRARLAAFVVVVLLSLGLGVGYVTMTSADLAAKKKPSSATAADRALSLKQVLAGPHIAFRSTALGPTYGKLAVVPLSQPKGGRAATDMECDRVYAVATGAVCVAADRGLLTTYKLSYLTADLTPRTSTALNGLPSRARMSSDGRLAATTMFVSGHSYAGNNFSTETTIHDVVQDKSFGSVEKWRILIDGKQSKDPRLNVWGVTFQPGPASDVFYATVAIQNQTWLAKGSLSKRELRTIHDGVECPSVSPDGTRVAYKKRNSTGGASTWRLTVLDLATGKETPLAETRSVDDQAEWLDDQRVLYGLQRQGTGTSDVWVTPADGSGKPAVFLPRAWSPAVVSTGSPAQ
jgi:hypothetical protein